MPSSKKTPNLYLNKWLGSDKPKKDDFNEDNEILDQTIGALQAKITDTKLVTEELLAAAEDNWKTKLDSAVRMVGTDISGMQAQLTNTINENKTELVADLAAAESRWNTGLETQRSTLTAHTASTAVHVTAAQKSEWSQNAAATGSFSGDGAAAKKITLGWKPRAGIVFAAGLPPVRSMWGSQTGDVYMASFAGAALSGGVQADSDGFTVFMTSAGADGYSYKLNESGLTYGYMVWR